MSVDPEYAWPREGGVSYVGDNGVLYWLPAHAVKCVVFRRAG